VILFSTNRNKKPYTIIDVFAVSSDCENKKQNKKYIG
jgi:hypothetical protein